MRLPVEDGLVSVFDLFSKQRREARGLRKALDLSRNKHRQSQDRFGALETLHEFAGQGNDEATMGLLRRFLWVYDKTIEDEQEKEWVYEVLLGLGPEKVLGPLRRFLGGGESISWGLRLLEQIAPREQTWEVLAAVLAGMEPGYERDPTRKIQLITFLGDFRDGRAAAALVPYLADMDEGVRFVTVEALIRQRNEVARDPLLDLLTDDREESRRIKVRIAEGFCDLGWNVHGHRGRVEQCLPEEYALDRQGHVKRKSGGRESAKELASSD